MASCNGTDCYYGFQTVTNPQAGDISGSYKSFIEVFSFIIFATGVVFNTGILTIMITVYPNLEPFDAYLMNLSFGELVASFGLSFMFFVEFTASIAPIGDSGCRFITWLDVTSVTITVVTLVALFFNYYRTIYGSRQQKLVPYKISGIVLMLWFIAAIPGLPYMATAKMTEGFCRIGNWSSDAEILYICAMIFFQCILPMAILTFLFIRILLVLRNSAGHNVLSNEQNPGSEEVYQREKMMRKFKLISSLALTFFVLLITVSFIALGLALDVSNIKGKPTKYARIRELESLMLCLKTIFVPLCYFCYYDKLRSKFMKCCFRRRNADIYNTLRYDVYQQTVSDGAPQGEQEENEEEIALSNENILDETDRDDVAILDNSM